MTAIGSLATSGAATPSTRRNSLQELGSDQFITLMVAQMRNQDPMKPTDPSEFLAQLAQFSTVSGVRAMQDSMSDMVATMRSSQMLSGTQLVGRDVLAAGDRVDYDGTAVVKGAAEFPAGLTSASLVVKDASGAVVRQISLPTDAGLNAFEWDGKSDSGAAAPPGRYTFEVAARSGNRIEPVSTLLASRVDSITLDTASGVLVLNTPSGALPLTAVRRVL